ncbi:hypothetical protein KKA69_06065, partial [Patescibacteria group bacterium]|nr:hypothetical protein [Patescibacteria group bacterium]
FEQIAYQAGLTGNEIASIIFNEGTSIFNLENGLVLAMALAEANDTTFEDIRYSGKDFNLIINISSNNYMVMSGYRLFTDNNGSLIKVTYMEDAIVRIEEGILSGFEHGMPLYDYILKESGRYIDGNGFEIEILEGRPVYAHIVDMELSDGTKQTGYFKFVDGMLDFNSFTGTKVATLDNGDLLTISIVDGRTVENGMLFTDAAGRPLFEGMCGIVEYNGIRWVVEDGLVSGGSQIIEDTSVLLGGTPAYTEAVLDPMGGVYDEIEHPDTLDYAVGALRIYYNNRGEIEGAVLTYDGRELTNGFRFNGEGVELHRGIMDWPIIGPVVEGIVEFASGAWEGISGGKFGEFVSNIWHGLGDIIDKIPIPVSLYTGEWTTIGEFKEEFGPLLADLFNGGWGNEGSWNDKSRISISVLDVDAVGNATVKQVNWKPDTSSDSAAMQSLSRAYNEYRGTWGSWGGGEREFYNWLTGEGSVYLDELGLGVGGDIGQLSLKEDYLTLGKVVDVVLTVVSLVAIVVDAITFVKGPMATGIVQGIRTALASGIKGLARAGWKFTVVGLSKFGDDVMRAVIRLYSDDALRFALRQYSDDIVRELITTYGDDIAKAALFNIARGNTDELLRLFISSYGDDIAKAALSNITRGNIDELGELVVSIIRSKGDDVIMRVFQGMSREQLLDAGRYLGFIVEKSPGLIVNTRAVISTALDNIRALSVNALAGALDGITGGLHNPITWWGRVKGGITGAFANAFNTLRNPLGGIAEAWAIKNAEGLSLQALGKMYEAFAGGQGWGSLLIGADRVGRFGVADQLLFSLLSGDSPGSFDEFVSLISHSYKSSFGLGLLFPIQMPFFRVVFENLPITRLIMKMAARFDVMNSLLMGNNNSIIATLPGGFIDEHLFEPFVARLLGRVGFTREQGEYLAEFFSTASEPYSLPGLNYADGKFGLDISGEMESQLSQTTQGQFYMRNLQQSAFTLNEMFSANSINLDGLQAEAVLSFVSSILQISSLGIIVGFDTQAGNITLSAQNLAPGIQANTEDAVAKVQASLNEALEDFSSLEQKAALVSSANEISRQQAGVQWFANIAGMQLPQLSLTGQAVSEVTELIKIAGQAAIDARSPPLDKFLNLATRVFAPQSTLASVTTQSQQTLSPTAIAEAQFAASVRAITPEFIKTWVSSQLQQGISQKFIDSLTDYINSRGTEVEEFSLAEIRQFVNSFATQEGLRETELTSLSASTASLLLSLRFELNSIQVGMYQNMLTALFAAVENQVFDINSFTLGQVVSKGFLKTVISNVKTQVALDEISKDLMEQAIRNKVDIGTYLSTYVSVISTQELSYNGFEVKDASNELTPETFGQLKQLAYVGDLMIQLYFAAKQSVYDSAKSPYVAQAMEFLGDIVMSCKGKEALTAAGKTFVGVHLAAITGFLAGHAKSLEFFADNKKLNEAIGYSKIEDVENIKEKAVYDALGLDMTVVRSADELKDGALDKIKAADVVFGTFEVPGFLIGRTRTGTAEERAVFNEAFDVLTGRNGQSVMAIFDEIHTIVGMNFIISIGEKLKIPGGFKNAALQIYNFMSEKSSVLLALAYLKSNNAQAYEALVKEITEAQGNGVEVDIEKLLTTKAEEIFNGMKAQDKEIAESIEAWAEAQGLISRFKSGERQGKISWVDLRDIVLTQAEDQKGELREIRATFDNLFLDIFANFAKIDLKDILSDTGTKNLEIKSLLVQLAMFASGERELKTYAQYYDAEKKTWKVVPVSFGQKEIDRQYSTWSQAVMKYMGGMLKGGERSYEEIVKDLENVTINQRSIAGVIAEYLKAVRDNNGDIMTFSATQGPARAIYEALGINLSDIATLLGVRKYIGDDVVTVEVFNELGISKERIDEIMKMDAPGLGAYSLKETDIKGATVSTAVATAIENYKTLIESGYVNALFADASSVLDYNFEVQQIMAELAKAISEGEIKKTDFILHRNGNWILFEYNVTTKTFEEKSNLGEKKDLVVERLKDSNPAVSTFIMGDPGDIFGLSVETEGKNQVEPKSEFRGKNGALPEIENSNTALIVVSDHKVTLSNLEQVLGRANRLQNLRNEISVVHVSETGNSVTPRELFKQAAINEKKAWQSSRAEQLHQALQALGWNILLEAMSETEVGSKAYQALEDKLLDLMSHFGELTDLSGKPAPEFTAKLEQDLKDFRDRLVGLIWDKSKNEFTELFKSLPKGAQEVLTERILSDIDLVVKVELKGDRSKDANGNPLLLYGVRTLKEFIENVNSVMKRSDLPEYAVDASPLLHKTSMAKEMTKAQASMQAESILRELDPNKAVDNAKVQEAINDINQSGVGLMLPKWTNLVLSQILPEDDRRNAISELSNYKGEVTIGYILDLAASYGVKPEFIFKAIDPRLNFSSLNDVFKLLEKFGIKDVGLVNLANASESGNLLGLVLENNSVPSNMKEAIREVYGNLITNYGDIRNISARYAVEADTLVYAYRLVDPNLSIENLTALYEALSNVNPSFADTTPIAKFIWMLKEVTPQETLKYITEHATKGSRAYLIAEDLLRHIEGGLIRRQFLKLGDRVKQDPKKYAQLPALFKPRQLTLVDIEKIATRRGVDIDSVLAYIPQMFIDREAIRNTRDILGKLSPALLKRISIDEIVRLAKATNPKTSLEITEKASNLEKRKTPQIPAGSGKMAKVMQSMQETSANPLMKLLSLGIAAYQLVPIIQMVLTAGLSSVPILNLVMVIPFTVKTLLDAKNFISNNIIHRSETEELKHINQAAKALLELETITPDAIKAVAEKTGVDESKLWLILNNEIYKVVNDAITKLSSDKEFTKSINIEVLEQMKRGFNNPLTLETLSICGIDAVINFLVAMDKVKDPKDITADVISKLVTHMAEDFVKLSPEEIVKSETEGIPVTANALIKVIDSYDIRVNVEAVTNKAELFKKLNMPAIIQVMGKDKDGKEYAHFIAVIGTIIGKDEERVLVGIENGEPVTVPEDQVMHIILPVNIKINGNLIDILNRQLFGNLVEEENDLIRIIGRGRPEISGFISVPGCNKFAVPMVAGSVALPVLQPEEQIKPSVSEPIVAPAPAITSEDSQISPTTNAAKVKAQATSKKQETTFSKVFNFTKPMLITTVVTS